MDKETIQEIGIWVLRVVLVIGAIIAGVCSNSDVAGGCITGLIASFFLL